MNIKQQVKAAFVELRSEGFAAHMNFMCCQTCAWSELTGKDNVVFYHKQDAQALNSQGNLVDGHQLYLAHKGNANRIVEVLHKHHVKTEWNGSTDTRIMIVGLLQ